MSVIRFKNLTIINRSAWPDWALKVICLWIVKRAGISWFYKITIKDTKYNTWGGRGGKLSQSIRIHRRYMPTIGSGPVKDIRRIKATMDGKPPPYIWPYEVKEYRFKSENFKQIIRSRLELLIMLLAHEAHHANGGHPDKFKNENNRRDILAMEIECNEESQLAVQCFRDNKDYFFRKLREACASERARNRNPSKLEITEKEFNKAQTMLDKWESKQQSAQKKVKKYARVVKRLEGKMAALKGEK